LSASSLACFALQRPVSSGDEHPWHSLSAPSVTMATFVSIRRQRSSSGCSAKLSARGPRQPPLPMLLRSSSTAVAELAPHVHLVKHPVPRNRSRPACERRLVDM